MKFEDVWAYTKTFEGGYCWWSKDKGGETFQGISRGSWPQWAGWPLIDRLKADQGEGPWRDCPKRWPGLDRAAAKDGQLPGLVADFYQHHFYEPALALGLTGPAAAKYFDLSVNLGAGNASKVLQRALVAAGHKNLVVDGVIGRQTRAAVAATDPAALARNLATAQRQYYENWLAGAGKAWAPQRAAFMARAAWLPV